MAHLRPCGPARRCGVQCDGAGLRRGERRALLACARRGQRQGPGRTDGHQGPARDRCGWPAALGTDPQGPVPARRRGRADGLPGSPTAASSHPAQRADLRRGHGSSGGRCDRRSARGPGPQAACPLHRRWLPGRAICARGRRASNDVDRSRVDGSRGRRGRGRRARPARLLQSGRPDGAAIARRSCAGALRSHRRRHELDQVPHRGARRRRAWPMADRRRSGES